MPKQAVAVELFYDGGWHDLVTSSDVLADTPITIMRGDGAESAAPRPASIALRLANDDDMYRTSNPLSPLYGKVGIGTPMRVSVAGQIRGYVEANVWKADETPDFRRTPKRGVAWVDVQGSGLLGRIAQWSDDVVSPLRLATEGLAGLIGYWPLEDKAGTAYGSPVVPGTSSVFMNGLSFGSQNSPPGGGTGLDNAPGSDTPGFRVLPGGDPNGTTGWQFSKVAYYGALDQTVGATNGLGGLAVVNGGGVRIYTSANLGTTTLLVNDGGGNVLATSSPSTAGYQWTGRWIMMHLEATYSAGTTTVTAYWQGVGDAGFSSFAVSYSGVPSDILAVNGAAPAGSTTGHIAVVKGFSSSLRSAARVKAFLSYPGELALTRAGRLFDQSSIPYYVSANWAKSAPMGPQGQGPLSDQLLLVRDTEDGLMYDFRTEGRIWLTARADRQNQTPKLTLDATPGASGMPRRPAEVTDDVPVHNIVTVSQLGGGDFTVEDDTSIMGTQPPPAGRGQYKQTVNVNLSNPDADLPQVAAWYLGRGTVAKPRYPTVEVDLSRLAGAALAAVEAVDIGDVILITNYREYTIRLFVVGYTETIGTHTRGIVFTCAPDDQFNVLTIGTGRLVARTTVLNADITASATSLTLKTSDPLEQFRVGSNAVPVLIGGELITLGTVAAVAGTGPFTQSVTGCTRAVNGIVKAHTAGDPVLVQNPLIAIRRN